MNYQRRKRVSRVIVKLCEALSAILGVRKLEFVHLQKKHSVNLLLLEKVSNIYNQPGEISKMQKSLSAAEFELYKFFVSNAQHNMHEFKILSDSFGFDYAGELEKTSAYMSAFPDEKNYSEELDSEIVLRFKKFNEHKTRIRNLEVDILTMDIELEIFKQEYEAFLQITRG